MATRDTAGGERTRRRTDASSDPARTAAVHARLSWMKGLQGGALRDDARDRQRFERGANDVRRPRAVRVVGRLGLEQLGVRQDHTELVVQAMEQRVEITGGGRTYRIVRHRGERLWRGGSCTRARFARPVYAAGVGDEMRNPSG